MAVYTHLDEVALKALWSVYDDEHELVRAEGIAAGSINTTYRLETEAGVFYLRINEGKSTDDVIYERDLLDALAAARLDVVTPTLKKTRVGGSFYLVEERPAGRVWGMVFPELPGRDLGVFEVGAAHTAQVGRFLARAHSALARRRSTRGRSNPYGLRVVERWLRGLASFPTLIEIATKLSTSLARVRAARRLLPRGVIHGDLFIDNTKWQKDDLAAVFDWEMAGSDHLALDLAVCVHAWCWRRDRGAFDSASARALVEGYQSTRPLSKTEKRGFFWEAMFAAIRFTTSRVRDFEVPKPTAAERKYLDYRDFLARLDVLEGMGDKGFRRFVGLL